MKVFIKSGLFTLFILFQYSLTAQIDVEIRSVSTKYDDEVHYVIEKENTENEVLHKFESYLDQGAPTLSRRLFVTQESYLAFIEKISYKDGDVELERKFAVNPSLAVKNKLKPLAFVRKQGNDFRLLDLGTNQEFILSVSLNADKTKISSIDVISGNNKSEGKSLSRAGTVDSWNFVELPIEPDAKGVNYYDSYQESFNEDQFIGSSSDGPVPFAQIDFEELEFEYRACKKVLGVNVCKNGTYKFELGQVISIKDLPENQDYEGTGVQGKHFNEINDVTAFCTPFDADYLLYTGYTLTAVIVDKDKERLTFLRDGLEPWDYGDKDGEVVFNTPIAVTEINQNLFVLNLNDGDPYIQVLEINHQVDGVVTMLDRGEISLTGLDIPSDIGGFSKDANEAGLLISSRSGLTYVNYSTTQSSVLSTKTFLDASSSSNESNVVEFSDLDRIDADHRAGTVVGVTGGNEIISFPISDLELDEIGLDFFIAFPGTSLVNNLAYMVAEAKWYVTDWGGKIHKLSAEGRYQGGGGTFGKAECCGELYLPMAITPNCIEDPTNDYRYRFIVANQWTSTTGFKLFAPTFTIPEFKVFENLNDENLVFAFTTSGQWEHVEFGRGISFSDLKINGISSPGNVWNAQISPGTVGNEGDLLTSVPNVIKTSPSQLTNLKRGWNIAEVEVIIFREGMDDLVVSEEIQFYWLPSQFTPNPTDLLDGEFRVNKDNTFVSDEGSEVSDYIYKAISLGDQAGFYAVGSEVYVSELGKLTFNNGSTFYNTTNTQNPLSNINFEENAKLNFLDNSNICVSGNESGKSSFFGEDFKEYIDLSDNYNLGVNPTNIPEYVEQCTSPCEFFDDGKSEVVLTSTIEEPLVIGESFNISISTLGTSYAEYLKWEIEKEVESGEDNEYVSFETESILEVDLTNEYNYFFESCSSYIVNVSVSCNGIDWINKTEILINTKPKISVGDSEEVCEGVASVTLEEFSPEGGVWTSDVGVVSSDGIIDVASLPLSSPVSLTYTVKDIYECEVSKSKELEVTKLPAKASLTSNTPVCEGDNIFLTAEAVGANSYKLIYPDNTENERFSGLFTIPNTSLSGAEGPFKVQGVKDGCEGEVSDPVSVTIIENPIVTAGDDQSVCGSVVIASLEGGNPTGGVWSGIGTAADGDFNTSISGLGIFDVNYIYTDQFGCSNEATKKINVGPIVEFNIETSYCIYDGDIDLEAQPIGGAWSGNGIESNTSVFNTSTAGIGDHVLQYDYIDETSCTASKQITVTVNAKPSAPVIDNTNSPVCSESAAEISVIPELETSYYWTGPNGYVNNGTEISANFSNLIVQGDYEVEAINNGCVSDKTLTTVEINQPTVLSITSDQEVCNTLSQITVEATPIGGDFSLNIEDLTSGSGYLDLAEAELGENLVKYYFTDENGCDSEISTTITLISPPLVSISPNNPIDQCDPDFNGLLLVAELEEGVEADMYEWTRNDEILTETTQILSVEEIGNYVVHTTNTCGSSQARLSLQSKPILSIVKNEGNLQLNIDNLNVGIDYGIIVRKDFKTVDEVVISSEILLTTPFTYPYEPNTHYSFVVSTLDQESNKICESVVDFDARNPINNAGLVFDKLEDDRVVVDETSSYAVGQGDFTIEFWINPEGEEEHTAEYFFSSSTDCDEGLLIGWKKEPGISPYLSYGFYGTSAWFESPALLDWLDGSCHFVSLVKENGELNLYVDSDLISTEDISTCTTCSPDGGRWVIGGSDVIESEVDYSGVISEMRFWNDGRTQREIENSMGFEVKISEQGLLSYFNFSEVSTQELTDLASSNKGYLGLTNTVEDEDPSLTGVANCSPNDCRVPTDLEVSRIEDGVSLLWEITSEDNVYDVRVKEVVSTDWVNYSDIVSTPYEISMTILGNVSYEFQVKPTCSADWSISTIFTSDPCGYQVSIGSSIIDDLCEGNTKINSFWVIAQPLNPKSIENYLWIVDDEIVSAEAQLEDLLIQDIGSHTVRLDATDSDSCVSSDVFDVNVVEVPVPVIVVEGSVCPGTDWTVLEIANHEEGVQYLWTLPLGVTQSNLSQPSNKISVNIPSDYIETDVTVTRTGPDMDCASKSSTIPLEIHCPLSIDGDVISHQNVYVLDVFPNPILDNQLTIKLSNASKEIYELKIIDNLGRLILQRNSLETNISYQFSSELVDLPTGEYIAEVIYANGNVISKKIIKE